MKLSFYFTWSSVFIGLTGGVDIVRLTVPELVEASNRSAVVLDCDYQVDDWEKDSLVLKWYLDKIHLVYQWIPPRSPQALGVLSGRVDTHYLASTTPWASHRALYIQRPDPSLSGQYSCSVSTFEDEDTETAPLLVWTPAQYVDLKYWRPSEHLVNVTCVAAGASPRPEFTLFTRDLNGTRQEVVILGENGGREDSGVWSAGAWGLIQWAETEPETTVGCKVTLPGTDHVHTTKKFYNPDLPIITTTTTTTTTTAATTTTRPPPPHTNKSQDAANNATKLFDFRSLFGSASNGMRELPCVWSYLCSLLFVATEAMVRVGWL